MGLVPAAGRLLTRDDDEIAAPLVAVVTYGHGERAFARDPGIIGQPYPVNGRAVTIVGVTPPGFTGAHVRLNRRDHAAGVGGGTSTPDARAAWRWTWLGQARQDLWFEAPRLVVTATRAAGAAHW
jgi:hypothetical protein